MSDADLFEDRVKLLFDTRLEELLEKINSEYPDPVYREEIIDKGADLIEQKKAFEEKLNALENDEYRKSHDRIMKNIKSEFQEAKDLTDQEMYKKARAYNKKFTIWKETSKTMEDLDNQLLLDKKMKEKINNFIGMVQSDIDGRQFDISGKSFLQGVLDKDAENAKLEQENANLISKHTRELAEKDSDKARELAEKDNAALTVLNSLNMKYKEYLDNLLLENKKLQNERNQIVADNNDNKGVIDVLDRRINMLNEEIRILKNYNTELFSKSPKISLSELAERSTRFSEALTDYPSPIRGLPQLLEESGALIKKGATTFRLSSSDLETSDEEGVPPQEERVPAQEERVPAQVEPLIRF